MKINDSIAKNLKKDFPIFKNHKDLVYLDNAATTQRPKQVIDAIVDFYENSNANVHRGVYSLSEDATELYDKSRKVVANFINAKQEEVVFTKGVTDSINLLSYSLEQIVPSGKDEIVLTEMEHHSNLIPWQQLAKRKSWKLKFIRMNEDFTLDLDDAKDKISKKTVIVAFTHVSNVFGTVNPVKKLVDIAKKNGALTFVDAAQSAGHMKIDVRKFDCDFLACSGHKMLGPFGVGVLYGKSELLEKLGPFEFGGGMIKRVSFEDAEFADVPMRFEAGTPNVVGAIALAEACKYLEKIRMDNIKNWESELTKYAISKLNGLGIETYCNSDSCSGIISINLEGVHPHDAASIFNDSNVCVRAGHHCNMPVMKKLGISGTVRISFCFYNTFEDVDKLIEGIKNVRNKFGK